MKNFPKEKIINFIKNLNKLQIQKNFQERKEQEMMKVNWAQIQQI